MGQPHSQPHQPAPTGKWLDGFKLAFLTSAVAALQFLRYQLTREERRQVRRCRGGQQAHNFIGDLPADFRRACVSLIDYHAMPLLVDQWRYVSFAHCVGDVAHSASLSSVVGTDSFVCPFNA